MPKAKEERTVAALDEKSKRAKLNGGVKKKRLPPSKRQCLDLPSTVVSSRAPSAAVDDAESSGERKERRAACRKQAGRLGLLHNFLRFVLPAFLGGGGGGGGGKDDATDTVDAPTAETQLAPSSDAAQPATAEQRTPLVCEQ